jgi:hypothetical protein
MALLSLTSTTTKKKSKATERREQLRKEYWPKAVPWTGEGDGWFKAPRTLPLLFLLLRTKRLSGREDPSRVYLALLARHMDSGVVEVTNEADLAYESGYGGQRAVHTWQERMQLLSKLGLIKIRPSGNQKYRYVLLVHPGVVIDQLRNQGDTISEAWLTAYVARRQEIKETSHEKRKKKRTSLAK